MKFSRLTLLLGATWTIGAYGAGQLLRLLTNVVLTRLLAPDLFGVMVLVNSMRTGVDLISDVGIRQSVVQNSNADKPEFYNTAWTLQLVRGMVLFGVCAALAPALAQLYETPVLAAALPVAALYFVLMGSVSIGVSLAQRRMQFKRLNVLDVALEAFASLTHITLALVTPTIWALVFGGLMAAAGRTVGSYFLMRSVRQRMLICREYAWQIIAFGKWIFLSSIVFFLSMNIDRLYLGKIVTLEFLGVYGIAKSLSDLFTIMVLRLCNTILFPLVASSASASRAGLRKQLFSPRMILLLFLSIGVSLFVAVADLVIEFLYDARYHDARWILPLLTIGAWFAILSNINELTLLGLGKPIYGTIGQGLKLGWLLAGLPIGYMTAGSLGAIAAIALSDLWRYPPALLGQFREKLSFGGQDGIATIVVFALVAMWQSLRCSAGLGTSFDAISLASIR